MPAPCVTFILTILCVNLCVCVCVYTHTAQTARAPERKSPFTLPRLPALVNCEGRKGLRPEHGGDNQGSNE